MTLLVKKNSIYFILLSTIYAMLFGLPSCIFQSNSKTPLASFFMEMEKKIHDKNILQEFRKVPRDSADEYMLIFSEGFNETFKDSSSNRELYGFLSKNEIRPETEFGTIVLLYAFQSYLNGKVIDLAKIKDEVHTVFKKRKIEKDEIQKKFDRELLNIIQTENNKWKEGDTLKFIFPIYFDGDTGGKSIYLSSYPLSLDYSDVEDTLKVKGILLKKWYVNSPEDKFGEIDSMNLVFRIRILELSDINMSILGKKYETGDDFDMQLSAYGRPID